MSVPEIIMSSTPVLDSEADAVLLAVPTVGDDTDFEAFPGLAGALRSIKFTGSASSFVRVPLAQLTDKPLAVVGLGDDADAAAVRNAVGAGVRSFTDVASLAVAIVGANADTAAAAAEGAALGGYVFEDYKTSGRTERAGTVTIHSDETVDTDRVAAIADAVALVRDLTNTPAEWMSPEQLADAAVAAVEGLPVEVTVWDDANLREEGFGGIIGVGQGSERPPRLVRLDYAPEGATRHIALVGKGITFDTGGLSLKPAAGMVGMKDDMAGAATVLAVVQGAAKTGAKTHITAWMAIADNMPSGIATRPGDVLRMFGGQTVEVLNTDAEGRLVLGDGIAKASTENPDVIIDVATLTGAILVALGTRHTGVFGDDEIVEEYLAAAKDAAEPAWHMPLPEYIEAELDSTIADMKNANMGSRFAGSSYAGLFLRRFVGKNGDGEDASRIPFLHLDIAGSAVNDGSPFGYTDKGATGATVRTLIELVSR